MTQSKKQNSEIEQTVLKFKIVTASKKSKKFFQKDKAYKIGLLWGGKDNCKSKN